MSRLEAEILTELPAWNGCEPIIEKCFDIVTELKPEGFREGKIALLLTSDDRMRALNAEWRGKDAPTNVLSFPAGEAPPGLPPEEAAFIGDIALGHEICVREAAEKGVPLEQHLSHLVLHGILHLLGYDHQEDKEAAVMEGMETILLKRLDLDDPWG